MLPLLNMQAAADDAEKISNGKKQQQQMMKVSISILVMSLPVMYVSFLHVPPATLFRDTTFWFLMSNSIIIVIAADSGMLFFAGTPPPSDDHLPLVVSGELLSPPPPMAVVKNQQAMVFSDDLGALVLAGEGQEVDGDAVIIKPESSTMMLVPYDGEVDGRRRLTASKSLADSNRSEERRMTTPRRRPRRSRSHLQALVAVPAPPVMEKRVVVREEKLGRTATEPLEPEEETTAMTATASISSEYSQLSDEELNRRVEEFIARFNMEIRLQLEKEEEQALLAAG